MACDIRNCVPVFFPPLPRKTCPEAPGHIKDALELEWETWGLWATRRAQLNFMWLSVLSRHPSSK